MWTISRPPTYRESLLQAIVQVDEMIAASMSQDETTAFLDQRGKLTDALIAAKEDVDPESKDKVKP